MSSEIIIYTTQDGRTKLQANLKDETVWLTQDQMAILFGKSRSTLTKHIDNIFKEGELEEDSVFRNFRRTGTDVKEYSVVNNFEKKLDYVSQKWYIICH